MLAMSEWLMAESGSNTENHGACEWRCSKPTTIMCTVENEETQAQRNTSAYREGVRDATEGRNFGRPDRHYPTEEERLSYRMGFYVELEAMEEEASGAPEEG
jgi:hypothetical protein